MDVVNVSNYRRTIHRFDVKLHASCPQCVLPRARQATGSRRSPPCMWAQGPVAGRAVL